MTKVLVLGATGMLGSAVIKGFANFDGQVIATKRGKNILDVQSDVEVRDFDADSDQISSVVFDLGPEDFIINCIGLVKAHIKDSSSSDVQRAIKMNALLPHKIQNSVASSGTKVIQIATDCVFSGTKGGYNENDEHDARDVYGKTKSLGEVISSKFMNIRVSIVGPEISGHTSLFDWVRLQPRNAEVQGYSDHIWNGITTSAFARISRGLIESGLFRAGVTHVLPSNQVSKEQLVKLIAASAGRMDIKILPVPSGTAVDRTLKTKDPDFNQRLWLGGGYSGVPSIADLLAEIGA